MITDTFDASTEAIISPEQLYGVQKTPCDVCIVTFSQQNVTDILATFSCEKIAQIESVNGAIPCYQMNYKGKEIAFYMTMVGSAGAAAFADGGIRLRPSGRAGGATTGPPARLRPAARGAA